MAPAEVPQKWDGEADVIIVGGGTGGLPAAIIVAEAGLKAIVLESRPQCGGSLGMVVGGTAFAGTDEQKAAGIDDSPDIFYWDLLKVSGSDPEIARAYVDNQLDAYNMLKDQGIKWPGLVPIPGHSKLRVLGWLPGYGPKLVKALEDRARARCVEILFRHRANRLITDPQTGKIIGTKVDVKGETKNFKAKRAVIIATGGFGRNREMIAEFAPEMVDCIPKMPVGHQGDGLKIGLDVGAATKDIGIAVAGSWPVCIDTHSRAIWILDWGGIMVNVHGKRFHDESSKEGFYGFMTVAGMKQPGGVYWVIFDEKIKDNVGKIEGTTERNMEHVKDVAKCKQYKADTLEELATIIGIDAKGLKETIDKYNSNIDSVGYDTVLGRRFQHGEARAIVKLTPPFIAVKCVTSTTSMKGGLKINSRSQVIDQYGEVIPRLYDAGEVTGGLHTKSYILAVMSSASMTQGIIAGRNAVKEPALTTGAMSPKLK